MCDARPIGVFDSGVGGVSVLRDLARLLPHEHFIYYGDNKNAPYGTRGEEEIRALSLDVAQWLLARNIKAMLVACNTATSAAVETLRAQLSIPVVGMEPALKPAYELHAEGQILVLATQATLRQKKFQRLYEKYGERAITLPCPGLVELAEQGRCEGAEVDAYLARRFAGIKREALSAVVLGCTHYSFFKRAIGRALPGLPLLDGNEGAARRLRYLLEENGTLCGEGEGRVEFFTSGDEGVFLPLMRRLFEMPI